MTIRRVGPNSTYPTIEDAVAAAAAGDTIVLEAGYSWESAELTVQDLTVRGGAGSRGITLLLGYGIQDKDVTLEGRANFAVRDTVGSNTITGNGGNNEVHVDFGVDVVHGGDGRDRLVVSYSHATTSVVATAGSVTDGGTNSVTFDGIEDLTITTGSGDDTLTTGAGNDVVQVNGGIDTVDAGDGRDQLNVYYGYSGANVTVSLSGGNLADGYSGLAEDSSGNSVSFTGVEHFLIGLGSGNDNVRTGAGRDTLRGWSGNDILRGGGGNDNISGGLGDDTLVGGPGRDQVVGDEGNDTLISLRGRDVLIGDEVIYRGIPFGERGADTFRFDDLSSGAGYSEMDTIMDLDYLDTIDLSRIDANVTAAGDQAFVFVDSFSGAAGEATLTKDAYGTNSTLALDTDGDSAADIRIELVGDHREFDNFVL